MKPLSRRLLAGALPLMVLTTVGHATPDWVRSLGRAAAYPDQTHVSGFGMSPADKSMPAAEKLEYARHAAAGNLVRALSVSVSSEQVVDSFSKSVNGREDLVDQFASRTVMRSTLQLDGLQYEEHIGRSSEPAYALATLHRGRARDHYAAKFAARMQRLVQLQGKANAALTEKHVDNARALYLECDQLVAEIEDIILIQELLGDARPMTPEALARLVDVRQASRELWERAAETIEAGARQVAVKLSAQQSATGTVQVNAFMREDSYQYSQFSTRFRSVLEHHLATETALKPVLLGEQAFRPHSAGLARRMAATGDAEWVLSGSYFEKPDGVHVYARLIKAADGTAHATAETRLTAAAIKGLELKPANYLQALKDRRVFGNRDLVGGGLHLEVWTNRGVDGLALQDGDEIKLYARANRPCYLRFIYHLANGARVVPDTLFLNYPISEANVNRVVELPGEFEACPPFGSETMQFFASTAEFPDLVLIEKHFDGESYDVLADSLAQSNLRHRGLRRKTSNVEVDEVRIPLTTVPK